MPDREQILLDSTSLMKHDPQVAEAILHPAPAGSQASRKLKAVYRLVMSFVPDAKEPPLDPIGNLERAAETIIIGRNAKGPSLGSVADRTNPHDPALRILFALRAIGGSIHRLAERRIMPPGHRDWSEAQARALGAEPPRKIAQWVTLGWRVDARDLLAAVEVIADVEQSTPPNDPRRPVVMACFSLVSRTIQPLRQMLRAAQAEQLELRLIDGRPGHYLVAYGPWPDDDAGSIAPKPAVPLSLPDPFMRRFEQLLDERIGAGLGEAMARTQSIARIRLESPSLFDNAVRVAGAAEIQLAAIGLVKRKFRLKGDQSPKEVRLLPSP